MVDKAVRLTFAQKRLLLELSERATAAQCRHMPQKRRVCAVARALVGMGLMEWTSSWLDMFAITDAGRAWLAANPERGGAK